MKKTSLLARYQARLTHEGWQPDPAQQAAVDRLQQLHDQLQQRPSLFRRKPTPGSLYLWGPVGRGKTMLMDLFCDSLPDTLLRLHFHRFMHMIHQQLFIHSGQPDPLKHIAGQLGRRYRVICFDEFYVADIGDAMLLGRLFRALFEQQIAIVSTSNCEPDQLYADGLHRDRFIPAIDMIKTCMEIYPLDGGIDHRRREQTQRKAYHVNQPDALHRLYHQLEPLHQDSATFIDLCNRRLPCHAAGSDSIWFSFEQLCAGPRSSADYMALAERYEHVLLDSVPCFRGPDQEQIKARGTEDGSGSVNPTGMRAIVQNRSDDGARRFIALVDELYDCRVNLYINADVAADQLYQGRLLNQPFQRTLSRLQEMNSLQYQSEPRRIFSEHKGSTASPDQTWNPGHAPE
ncbi:cell division protein ZapE [Neptuniibacter halophilus]|uniref:cell division protein ZapE n=1 Tax=Neptuniibacter halophilus TaxID=651666 RepID=UPI002574205B|nr:cell division protein ZapE [Neptuniibacter halophilus]